VRRRKFIENSSEGYQDAVRCLTRLREDEGLDAAERAFAEAVWECRRNALFEKPGLRLAPHVQCLRGMQGMKCWQHGAYCRDLPPAHDHSELLTRNGRPEVFYSQPYRICFRELVETMEYCREHALEATIDAWGSSHFPGRTLLIAYRGARVAEPAARTAPS